MTTTSVASRRRPAAPSESTSAKRRKRKAEQPAIDPEQDYRTAMRNLIAHRWDEVWRAVPIALAGEDIEGVHDVRVASRRLRAAMDVGVDCFPASWYRPLHRAAKEITGALGEVRDRDVLIETWTRERSTASSAERPGIDRLIDRIERERSVARVEMERFLVDVVARGVPKETVRRFGAGADLARSADGMPQVEEREAAQ